MGSNNCKEFRHTRTQFALLSWYGY